MRRYEIRERQMASILLVEDILMNYRNRNLCTFLEEQGHSVSRVRAEGEQFLMPIRKSDIAISHVGRGCSGVAPPPTSDSPGSIAMRG